MVSTPLPPIIMGGLNLKICQNFVGTKFFLHLWGNKPLWGELKLCRESNIYYFTFSFIFLETANTQKSEVFLLRVSSGNVNT